MKTLVLLGLAFTVGAPSRIDAREGDGAQLVRQEDDRMTVKLDTSTVPYQIVIDGTVVPPLIFFFNTDVRNDRYLAPQVKLAAAAGVHIYSFPLRIPMRPGGLEPNYKYGEMLLDKFIVVDPEAKFLVRLVIGPNGGWREFQPWGKANLPERIRYADGSLGQVSFASKYFDAPTDAHLRKIVSYFEDSSYGERIVAYHSGSNMSEMFDTGYRAKGPDYSPANTGRFQTWLREKYRDEHALRASWRRPEVSFGAAKIPQPAPSRFPMRNIADPCTQVFYDPETQRDWIDFSEYCSDLMAGKVIRWARIVKQVTAGRKLTVTFYGYTFSLPGSFSGHLALGEVLQCQDVDVLCAPYAYHDRAPGGTANFMSPVDSVVLHRKLWINEDDARTHLMDPEIVNRSRASLLKVHLPQNMQQTLGVLDRNLAAVSAHGAGIWWMDLTASGAFNAPEIWDQVKRRTALLRSESSRAEMAPEVLVLVDEASKRHVAADYSFNRNNLYQVRDAALKSGTTIGYYLLDDYVAGAAPKARMVIFANAFRLSDAQTESLHERIEKDQSAVVWMYMPGYLDGRGGRSLERVRRVTGFTVRNVPGKTAAIGMYELARCRWNEGIFDQDLSPRPVIVPGRCRILANYASDSLPAVAGRTRNGRLQFFVGCPGPGVSAEVFRRLFKMAGVHVWTPEQEAIVQSNGKILTIYTGRPGPVEVDLPPGTEATPLDAAIVRQTPEALFLELDERGIAWLRIEHE